MKQIFKILLLSGCGVLLALLLAFYLQLPSQPDSWSSIKLGMTSDQVYGIEPTFKEQSWKDVKGYDIMTASRGQSYWQMELHYDNNVVSSIQKRLYHGGLSSYIYETTIP